MPPLGWSLALLWLGAIVGFCMAALLCASGQASREQERQERLNRERRRTDGKVVVDNVRGWTRIRLSDEERNP